MVHIRLREIEEYAKINNVPIMQKDGINYLTGYVKDNEVKTRYISTTSGGHLAA